MSATRTNQPAVVRELFTVSQNWALIHALNTALADVESLTLTVEAQRRRIRQLERKCCGDRHCVCCGVPPGVL